MFLSSRGICDFILRKIINKKILMDWIFDDQTIASYNNLVIDKIQ